LSLHTFDSERKAEKRRREAAMVETNGKIEVRVGWSREMGRGVEIEMVKKTWGVSRDGASVEMGQLRGSGRDVVRVGIGLRSEGRDGAKVRMGKGEGWREG
jgi:hypothetical protein